ncbi:MAG TPA: cache domain-containing protein, partial [Spirochaetota bacterium]|nr:cache domain-containing protein [Spirochaetota bacterium]
MSSLTKNMNLKTKMVLIFFIIILMIVAVYSVTIYFVSKNMISKSAITKMNLINQGVYDIIDSSIGASIVGYLRGISEKNREVVALYYDKYKKGLLSEKDAKQQVREILLSQKIGKTGYIFVWNIKNAPQSVILDVHPAIEGKDVASVSFVQDGFKLKTGYMEYAWKNPNEEKERDKAMYLSYFPEWDWIVAVSSYKEEFLDLVDMNSLKKKINSIKIGKTDYVTVVDYQANVLLHPYLEGKNIYELKDNTGKFFMKEMCEKKSGIINYNWKKNKDDTGFYKKFVVFKDFPLLNFIIITGAYEDELYEDQKSFNLLLFFTSIIIYLIVLPLLFF